MTYTSLDIKKLRAQTGAGVMDCKKALEEAKGDMKKATAIVKKRGMARAEKKADRETKEGYVTAYVHATGTVAAMVEILCETDFVARNEELRSLSYDLAMQVASMNPKNVAELLRQEYIKDPSVTIDDLVKLLSGKIGEKLVVNRFVRFELGEKS